MRLHLKVNYNIALLVLNKKLLANTFAISNKKLFIVIAGFKRCRNLLKHEAVHF